MSRLIVVSFAVLALLQATLADDPSVKEHIHIQLTDKDIVPTAALKSQAPDTFASGFIGDLELGKRSAGETVYQSDLPFINPTKNVRPFVVYVTSPNYGIIHYLSIRNKSGSQAVICEMEKSLGTPTAALCIRSVANSRSHLEILVGSH